MAEPATRPAPVPATRSLRAVRDAAAGCQACPLYRDATQTFFGVGRKDAQAVIVGEQPGTVEDREGEPFVGPAGRLLHKAMAEADLDRSRLYLTNAVKHTAAHRMVNGRRLHDKPNAAELAACRPWLRVELTLVRPRLLVVLGASAAATALGRSFRVTRERGQPRPWTEFADHSPLFDDVGTETSDPLAGAVVIATVHPSAVLRARDHSAAYDAFVDDLRVVANHL